MPVEYQGAICANPECKQPVSSVMNTPCPHCGSTSRTHGVHASDSMHIRSEMTWMHERKEIIRKRPWIRYVLLAFDFAALIGGLFIGQVAGAAIGLVLILAGEIFGPKALQVVITRTQGQAH